MSLNKEEILEAIAQMSVMDICDLVSAMEEKFGVSAAAAVGYGALGLVVGTLLGLPLFFYGANTALNAAFENIFEPGKPNPDWPEAEIEKWREKRERSRRREIAGTGMMFGSALFPIAGTITGAVAGANSHKKSKSKESKQRSKSKQRRKKRKSGRRKR